MFDPKGKYGDGDKGLPAGDFLLAMVSYERRTSKAGGPMVRARYKVIAGPLKGQSFFASNSISMSSDGAKRRLASYCTAVGQEDPFDPAKDSEFDEAFLGRPFKATITKEINGQYVNNDIKKFHPELGPREQELCDQWWAEWSEKNSNDSFAGGGDDDYEFPGDSDFGGGSGKGSKGGDNIPF